MTPNVPNACSFDPTLALESLTPVKVGTGGGVAEARVGRANQTASQQIFQKGGNQITFNAQGESLDCYRQVKAAAQGLGYSPVASATALGTKTTNPAAFKGETTAYATGTPEKPSTALAYGPNAESYSGPGGNAIADNFGNPRGGATALAGNGAATAAAWGGHATADNFGNGTAEANSYGNQSIATTVVGEGASGSTTAIGGTASGTATGPLGGVSSTASSGASLDLNAPNNTVLVGKAYGPVSVSVSPRP